MLSQIQRVSEVQGLGFGVGNIGVILGEPWVMYGNCEALLILDLARKILDL